MTYKEKTIKELKEVLDSLDITNKYRLNLIRAIEYLQEEPVSKEIGDYDHKAVMESLHPELKEEPVSDGLEEAAELYTLDDSIKPWRNLTKEAFKAGANWQKQQTMKDAIETTLSKGLEEDYNIKGKYKAYIIVIKED